MAPMRLTALLTASSMLLASAPAWATDVAQATGTAAETSPTRLQYDSYRTLSGAQYREFERLSDYDSSPLLACVEDEGEDFGRRERGVTQYLPFRVIIDEAGALTVRYEGDGENDATPDDDETIQDCIDEIVEGQEIEDVPEQFWGSTYRWTYWNDNYLTQRRKRHSEIIALYTLSAVSLGTGIGALVAAGNDRDEASERANVSLDGPTGSGNALNDRADRFRIAGWTMIGVSAVSFIGADILLIRNRRIERAENPYFAASPVGPGGSLGLSFSGRF